MQHFELCPDCKSRALGDRRPSMAAIKAAVSRVTGIPIVQMIGESRSMGTVQARHIAISLCSRLTGQSSGTIGRAFGDRDHSTILHSLRTMRSIMNAIDLEDDAPLEQWARSLVERSPVKNYRKLKPRSEPCV